MMRCISGVLMALENMSPFAGQPGVSGNQPPGLRPSQRTRSKNKAEVRTMVPMIVQGSF